MEKSSEIVKRACSFIRYLRVISPVVIHIFLRIQCMCCISLETSLFSKYNWNFKCLFSVFSNKVVGSVFQPTWRSEFEDGLNSGVQLIVRDSLQSSHMTL